MERRKSRQINPSDLLKLQQQNAQKRNKKRRKSMNPSSGASKGFMKELERLKKTLNSLSGTKGASHSKMCKRALFEPMCRELDSILKDDSLRPARF